MDGSLQRICAIGILCALVGVILRRVQGEIGGLARVAGAVLIFGAAVLGIHGVATEAAAQFSSAGITAAEPYANVLIRALGIALLTKISSELCRDAGEGTVASGVELAGKAAILALCLPLVGEILGYASRILGGE